MVKNTNENNFSKNERNNVVLISSIIIVLIATIIGIFFIRQYIINRAEERIQEVMQEAEALHDYVQQEMHSTMDTLKKEGRMPKEFFSPQLLSSSYIARNVFKHLNIIRKMNNQPLVDYKMASKNPRNKINQANSLEASLIDRFNQDSTIKEYTGIATINGEKQLIYARPFLRVDKNCLKCHGRREDAPKKTLREH